MTEPRRSVAQLVAGDDLDGLLRRIDELCDGADWVALADLRSRCRTAHTDTGRQLWPAASHAEYRLALQAPGSFAAAVLEQQGAGRFAVGPLAEVAASTHAWADLAPWLGTTPEALRFAEERVARGEGLSAIDAPWPGPELPLSLQAWEPEYPVATYEAHRVTVADVADPATWVTGLGAVGRAVGGPGRPADDPLAAEALAELASAWVTQSDGRCRVAVESGDAASAISSLAGPIAGAVAEVDPAHAFALMAWAGASGGAHGRRRGLAYGRFAAWWAAAALGGLDPDAWPHPPEQVGEAAAALRWYRWRPAGEPLLAGGWALRLAAESPVGGRAWAVEATDHA